jgi:hypothetical protein
MHRSEAIYGPEAKIYLPERWESGELIKKVGLGAGFVDFNGGPRVCLGSMSSDWSVTVLDMFANDR